MVWAEGRPVYIRDAQLDGSSSLLRSYAGYLQLVSRMGALVLTILPLRQASIGMAVAAVVIATTVACLVYRATSGMIRSVPLRLVAPLLIVVGPAAGSENTANLVNSIWALFVAVPFLLLARTRGWIDTTVRCSVVALAVLSHALVLLFAPLALAVALRRRDRASLAMCVTYAVSGTLQLVVVALGPSRPKMGTNSPGAFVKLFGLDVIGEFLVGNWHGRAWERFGVAFAFGVILRLRGPRHRGSLAIGPPQPPDRRGAHSLRHARRAAPIISNGTSLYRLNTGVEPTAARPLPGGSRPALRRGVRGLLDPIERRWDLVGVVGRWLLVAQTLLFIVIWFPSDSVRGDGPIWSQQVRSARDQCATLPDDASVGIGASPPAFVTPLPCEVVER